MLLIHLNPSHWSINWSTLSLTLKVQGKNTTWELYSAFTLQLSKKPCNGSSLPLTCKQTLWFLRENALASPFACGSRMNSHNSPKWRASLHAALPFNCRSSWNWWNLVLIQFITQHRKATTFLIVYHENKGLCKKNTCNVWKLVWLLTVCTSYPPVIMSLTVTVCQWTGGSNLLPLVPSIPCYHPFYWIPPLSYFCCVMSFIHFPPPYNAHSHSFLSHPSHPLLSLAPMPLSTFTV